MNKEEFFNQIKEAESNFYKNDPCHHCFGGNGCDDCRGCKDGEISHKMWIEVNNLKKEYKEKFGADYDKEVEALDKAHREKTRKAATLKEAWDTCTLNEIIKYGIENDKCNKCDIEYLINWL